MPLICYIPKNFGEAAVARINLCNEIIDAYAAQGFDLTLRQLYYQLVSRAVIANTEREYKNLGGLVNDSRLAGLIDWNSIVDRTRELRKNAHWETPAEIVESCASQYRVNLWDGQEVYCEVWIEKDALVGVIEGVCRELDVPFFSCRGYTSQSEMWSAAQRIMRACNFGRPGKNDKEVRLPAATKLGRCKAIVFHLGDHDPSGRDMTRDIQARLDLFIGPDCVEVDRLALNWDQIEQYSPPPNPAKVTDSRAAGYIAEFGAESWELDALEPAVIVGLIREAVEEVIDSGLRRGREREQQESRVLLKRISEGWDGVVAGLAAR